MTAALLLGGLGALGWAAAALLTARSSRALGSTRSVLWLGVGAVPFGVTLALLDEPLRISGDEVLALVGASVFLLVATQLWAIIAGSGNVSLAAPIVACDGAVAALLAVFTGHTLPVLAYIGLSAMVGGLIVLSAGHAPPDDPEDPGVRARLSGPATVALSIAAAAGYGAMLFCAGTVEDTSPLWTVTIARAAATVGALGLCLAQGAVRPVGGGARFALLAGTADVTAFSLFVAGAQHDLAIAAVAVSQYGAVATLIGVGFLGDRLSARQWAGVAVLVVGAGVVAATG